jgi:mono/diheme cytochrome c family protein
MLSRLVYVRHRLLNSSLILAATSLVAAAATEKKNTSPIPAPVQQVLEQHCYACHDSAEGEAGINLDLSEIDWSAPGAASQWEKTLNVITHKQMPPVNKKPLTPKEKQTLLSYLDAQLAQHTTIGGTQPRRLNRIEYRNSIRTVFQMSQFELPLGFPRDTRDHGFDTVSEALVLSPPLLEAYQQVAWQIADELFPPAQKKPPVTTWKASVEDLVLSFSAATIHGDALRLASRSPDIMRSCTWPSKIEITTSGTYRISISTSAFRPKKGAPPMLLQVRARDVAANDRSRAKIFRLLKEIPVTSETPATVTFEAELYEGQTPLFHWINAELDHEPEPFSALLEQKFQDQRFLAAWQEMIFPGDLRKRISITPLRGRNGWNILQKHYQNPKLNLADATLDNRFTKAALDMAKVEGTSRALADTLAYHYHENGPALQLHSVQIEGPFKIVDGPKDLQRRKWREYNFATRNKGESDEAYASRALGRLLPRLFRRPVTEDVRRSYVAIAKQHWEAGHSFDEGLHLMLRSTLVSPRFLYRETNPGPLDAFDLASRVAYFLTRDTPTSTIVHQARSGALTQPTIYRAAIESLLPKSPSSPMIRDFTEQWLDTRLLPEIMPDEAFKFSPEEIEIAKAEVEHFFFTILKENRPLRDFIDPDFLTTSKRFAMENYGYTIAGLKPVKPDAAYFIEHRKIEQLPIQRGGVRGGLLGQSAIMMATANGVDTQPVLRGVWVLENILGIPLPPVPSNVPALTPDTQGAKTPRDILAAHTQAADCRGCHQQIDPVGFVLENFDPVGGWRDRWPGINVEIDPSGVLPDGTEILGYPDLKRWMVENIHLFAQCLSEKLMIYATGRIPSYAEKQEIKQIVTQIEQKKGGFRDLLLALMESQTFKTR